MTDPTIILRLSFDGVRHTRLITADQLAAITIILENPMGAWNDALKAATPGYKAPATVKPPEDKPKAVEVTGKGKATPPK